jgi:hypothetical protein
MDLEDKNQNVIPGAWRNDKVLLDVYHERAKNTETQEGRLIRRYLGHYFTSETLHLGNLRFVNYLNVGPLFY